MSDKPRLKMVEIYSGKDPAWKGWHNLVLTLGDPEEGSKSIQGPIDPETSSQILEAIEGLTKRG